MKDTYNEDRIEKKLAAITWLIEKASSDPNQIDAKEIRASLDKSQKLVDFLNNNELDIPLDKYNHFLKSTLLLIQLLEIQKRMSDLVIKEIDPTPPGLASKLSNSLPSLTEKIGSDDASILLEVLKIVSKPISYVMGIFESVSPDKWRVANNWERVKLVTGVTLTLVGVACVVAAIVIGVANPVGLAVVGGIGATLFVGSVALGLASVLCLGIGGVFLKQTGSALSNKLNQKQDLDSMKIQCDESIKKLNNKIALVLEQDSPDKKIDLSSKQNSLLIKLQRLFTINSIKRSQPTTELDNVQLAVLELKNKLKATQ